MIRVMLVDDQRLARLGFQLMLDDVTDITVIASAENGQTAIDTLNQLDADHRPLPDVILMDVRMPGMDGIEATRHIARHWPSSSSPPTTKTTTPSADSTPEPAASY